jgi:protein O-mannosyl-transferase
LISFSFVAEFLAMVSRDEEACEHRVKAAELASKDYSLVVSAATALRLLDRKEEAEQWYRQVNEWTIDKKLR